MSRSNAAYVLGAVFVAVFTLSYTSTLWFEIPVPRYYPLEHTWKMVQQSGVPSQAWYGRVGFALVLSGLVALVLSAVLKGLKREVLTSGWIRILGLCSVLVVVGCIAYLVAYELSTWGVF